MRTSLGYQQRNKDERRDLVKRQKVTHCPKIRGGTPITQRNYRSTPPRNNFRKNKPKLSNIRGTKGLEKKFYKILRNRDSFCVNLSLSKRKNFNKKRQVYKCIRRQNCQFTLRWPVSLLRYLNPLWGNNLPFRTKPPGKPLSGEKDTVSRKRLLIRNRCCSTFDNPRIRLWVVTEHRQNGYWEWPESRWVTELYNQTHTDHRGRPISWGIPTVR